MDSAELVTMPTPAGAFTMIAVADGVLASGFTEDVDRLLALINPRLRPSSLTRVAPEGAFARDVAAYLDGELGAIDRVPLLVEGAPFLGRAWQELRAVPAGQTVSYRELAARAGNPRAIRAAGQACARNPVTLFVPCHRAVGSDGRLNHFGWGLPVKRWLLDHEAGRPALVV